MRAGDQSAIEAIFEAGMRYYSDPLPAGSVLKRSWERYIQNALASDLADIQGVYFARSRTGALHVLNSYLSSFDSYL